MALFAHVCPWINYTGPPNCYPTKISGIGTLQVGFWLVDERDARCSMEQRRFILPRSNSKIKEARFSGIVSYEEVHNHGNYVSWYSKVLMFATVELEKLYFEKSESIEYQI